MTSSVFYIEPLHVHLTNSASKGFVDNCGFMEQIKKLKFKDINLYYFKTLKQDL
jgi:hypothetical protein